MKIALQIDLFYIVNIAEGFEQHKNNIFVISNILRQCFIKTKFSDEPSLHLMSHF